MRIFAFESRFPFVDSTPARTRFEMGEPTLVTQNPDPLFIPIIEKRKFKRGSAMPSPKSLDQNESFKPNCNCRGSKAPPASPKFVEGPTTRLLTAPLAPG